MWNSFFCLNIKGNQIHLPSKENWLVRDSSACDLIFFRLNYISSKALEIRLGWIQTLGWPLSARLCNIKKLVRSLKDMCLLIQKIVSEVLLVKIGNSDGTLKFYLIKTFAKFLLYLCDIWRRIGSRVKMSHYIQPNDISSALGLEYKQFFKGHSVVYSLFKI